MATSKRSATAIRKSPIIMVSSTVYGIESLLDQIFAQLRAYGYTVWMSRRGTIQLSHGKSAFGSCLQAVDMCDIFLGIITGSYGSGVDNSGPSITHREINRAIKSNRPRWFLVEHDVAVARQVLKSVRINSRGCIRKCFCYKKSPIVDDYRVIEMYEKAMRLDIPLERRKDNWVQEFPNHEFVRDFIDAQFSDISRIRAMLAENAKRRKK
jgi:hypothetical protein